MTITITYKGTTVSIDSGRSHKFEPEAAMKIISETIDKINTTCNNCTVEKQEGYGK